jgi:hypothetical protein
MQLQLLTTQLILFLKALVHLDEVDINRTDLQDSTAETEADVVVHQEDMVTDVVDILVVGT